MTPVGYAGQCALPEQSHADNFGRAMEYLLIALLAFMPFAFGVVEAWSEQIGSCCAPRSGRSSRPGSRHPEAVGSDGIGCTCRSCCSCSSRLFNAFRCRPGSCRSSRQALSPQSSNCSQRAGTPASPANNDPVVLSVGHRARPSPGVRGGDGVLPGRERMSASRPDQEASRGRFDHRRRSRAPVPGAELAGQWEDLRLRPREQQSRQQRPLHPSRPLCAICESLDGRCPGMADGSSRRAPAAQEDGRPRNG